MLEEHIDNLDALDRDELIQYASTLRDLDVSPEEEQTRRLLAQYATLKARAIGYRLAGRINEALYTERRCDRVYQEIPEPFRW